MKKENYLDKCSNVFAQNTLLKFAIVLFGVASVVSSIVSYAALTYHTTVILPSHVDSKITISGNSADDQYIKSFTYDIMSFLLTYNPDNAEYNFGRLLLHVDPQNYETFKSRLNGFQSDIVKLGISSVFYPIKITVDPNAKIINVLGIRKQWANDLKISDKKSSYQIKYVIVDGRLIIQDIKES